MSKILLYQEASTGVTTGLNQHAFFINENGIPAVKNGSQVITFGTSGYAMQGSSGSSGMNGTNGLSGTSGISGTSGQDGAPGDIGPSGSSGSSGMSGTSGINGIDGANGTSGMTGASGTSGISYGTSGSSGADGSQGISGSSGTSGADGLGAKSKAGSIAITGFTLNPTTTNYEYDVVFAEAYGNTNYSVSINLVDTNTNNIQDPYNYYPIWTSEKTVSGFTINTLGDPSTYPTVTVEWMAISQGETGVASTSGISGTNGVGVPVGGSTGQVLAKASATDYDTEWVDQSGGGGSSITYITKKSVSYMAAGDTPNSYWRHAPLVGITTTTAITIPANTLRMNVVQIHPQAIITDLTFIVSGTAGTAVNIGIYKMGVVGSGATAYLVPTDLVHTVATDFAINTAGQKTITGLNIDMSNYSTEENIYCIGIQAITTTATITHFSAGQTLAPGWGSYIISNTVYRLGAYVTATGQATLPATISTTITGATESPYILWKQN